MPYIYNLKLLVFIGISNLVHDSIVTILWETVNVMGKISCILDDHTYFFVI